MALFDYSIELMKLVDIGLATYDDKYKMIYFNHMDLLFELYRKAYRSEFYKFQKDNNYINKKMHFEILKRLHGFYFRYCLTEKVFRFNNYAGHYYTYEYQIYWFIKAVDLILFNWQTIQNDLRKKELREVFADISKYDLELPDYKKDKD